MMKKYLWIMCFALSSLNVWSYRIIWVEDQEKVSTRLFFPQDDIKIGDLFDRLSPALYPSETPLIIQTPEYEPPERSQQRDKQIFGASDLNQMLPRSGCNYVFLLNRRLYPSLIARGPVPGNHGYTLLTGRDKTEEALAKTVKRVISPGSTVYFEPTDACLPVQVQPTKICHRPPKAGPDGLVYIPGDSHRAAHFLQINDEPHVSDRSYVVPDPEKPPFQQSLPVVRVKHIDDCIEK